jgi:hypothetical protein
VYRVLAAERDEDELADLNTKLMAPVLAAEAEAERQLLRELNGRG